MIFNWGHIFDVIFICVHQFVEQRMYRNTESIFSTFTSDSCSPGGTASEISRINYTECKCRRKCTVGCKFSILLISLKLTLSCLVMFTAKQLCNSVFVSFKYVPNCHEHQDNVCIPFEESANICFPCPSRML